MQDEGKQSGPTDSILKQALSHPKRIEIFGYLRKKRETGTDEAELADALDLSVSRVKYHLIVLQGANLIAHVDDLKQSRYVAATSAGM